MASSCDASCRVVSCRVVVYSNQLHDQDAILLAECFGSMPGLQELDLAGKTEPLHIRAL